MSDGNAADSPRGRPFEKGQSGNPSGRPRGARNRATLAAQELLDGEAEALTRKAVELALGGDMNALRLCLDRVIPPRRDRPLHVAISGLEAIHDAPKAMADIIASVASELITLPEAMELCKLVMFFVQTCEASDRAKLRAPEIEGLEEIPKILLPPRRS